MKIFHNRVNDILILLLMILELVILIVYSIPNFIDDINFVKSFKDLIIAGYVDECFWQKVIYGLAYCISHTLTCILAILFSIITLFKHRTIKVVGKIIIVQNIVLLSLRLWRKFLINELKNIVLVDIKLYLFIFIFLAAFIVLISLRRKIFYLILNILTILQLINAINFAKEFIASIYNTRVLFACFSEIFMLILYWVVLISINKNIELTTN